MRRVLVIGSSTWNDRRLTANALRRVMEVYRPPYSLITDRADGASRYAAAVAADLGWTIDPYEVDVKCVADCNPGHRRKGTVHGDYCPTARWRTMAGLIATEPDLVLVLARPVGRESGAKLGQSIARDAGIAVWEYRQKGAGRGDTNG